MFNTETAMEKIIKINNSETYFKYHSLSPAKVIQCLIGL